MGFVNSLFPNPKLIHGLQKGYASPVLIVGNNQVEYRIKKLANYRTTWTWPARLMSAASRKALASFYTDVANFSLNSFLYQDPDGSAWNLTPLTYTGTANYFYLTTAGTNSTHPVFHIDGACIVKNSSGTSVSFTQSVVNGQPVISVPGYTSGITITGVFYHAVRFDQSEMNWSMEALASDNTAMVDNLGDLKLIEVFEY